MNNKLKPIKDVLGISGFESKTAYTHEELITVLTWYITHYSWIANNRKVTHSEARELARANFDNQN